MNKILMAIIIISMVLVVGCLNSYEACVKDCKVTKNYTFYCAFSEKCEAPELDKVKKECYDECRS